MSGWRDQVGDLRQLASVRRIVLDDGTERGLRTLAFSTGGGVDFWVLADRSFDIGPLWYMGCPMAWQSPSGFAHPAQLEPESDGGTGFNRGFSGLLVTCGLDHVRQPHGGQPLHGRLPFTPGRLLAYGENWEGPQPHLYCEGEVVQARYGGEALRLRRRITAPVGGRSLRIEDTVENIGPEPSACAVLYHLNLGFPAVGAGTTVSLAGEPIIGPLAFPDAGASLLPECRPSGEGHVATCLVETPSEGHAGLTFRLSYTSESLRYFQTWHDLRPRVGVLSLEPCTSERQEGGRSGRSPTLAPGDRLSLALELSIDGLAPAWQTLR
ncbi:MAG: DUF4432 family protein [Alsobacter sp.]